MSNNINSLSADQLTLLGQLMRSEISRDDFLKHIGLPINLELALNESLKAKVRADHDFLRQILYGLGAFLSDLDKRILFRFTLVDLWHTEHDELVGAFQFPALKDADNIEYIKWIMLNLPDYLERDEAIKDAFIRKCAYAIAAQPAPYNEEALRELSQSSDEVIKKYALHQLVKNGFDT